MVQNDDDREDIIKKDENIFPNKQKIAKTLILKSPLIPLPIQNSFQENDTYLDETPKDKLESVFDINSPK